MHSPLRGAVTDTSIVPPLPDYPERIVTFIDLLGFSRDVKMIEERPGLLLSIDAVLSAIDAASRVAGDELHVGEVRNIGATLKLS